MSPARPRPLILVLLSVAMTATALANQTSFYSRPDIHGDAIVFCSEGDLWLGSVSARTARRITSDPGLESNPKFSPDGTKIAFTGQYDGGRDVYVVDVNGGEPKRLTYDPAGADVLGWTPSGDQVLFRSRRNSPVGAVRYLFSVPAAGGIATKLPVPYGEFAAVRGDGLIAYVPISREWMSWFRYNAGAADIVWTCDPKSGSFKKLTKGDYVVTTPVWCGNDLYVASEKDGVSNLARLDTATGKETELTHFKGDPLRYPSTDGTRIVFEHGPGLGVYDPSDGKTFDLDIAVDSDRIHMRADREKVSTQVASYGIGPTGKRFALEVRGQLVSAPVGDGDFRVLDAPVSARDSMPAWSPDGNTLVFVSDRSGENEFWTIPAAGGASKQLTKGMKGEVYQPRWSPDGTRIAFADVDGHLTLVDAKTGERTLVDTSPAIGSYDGFEIGFSFSPDGKWLAYDHNSENWTSSVYLYEIATGKSTLISDPAVNSFQPAFTSDGKYLAYLADRQLDVTFPNLTGRYSFGDTTKINLCVLAKDTPSPFLPKVEDEGTVPKTETKAEAKPEAKPETKETKEAKPEAPATKVDLDGIADRVIDVPAEAGKYSVLRANADRLFALGGGKLVAFDLKAKSLTTLTEGVRSFELSADGKKLAVRKSDFGVLEAASGPAEPKRVDLAADYVEVNPTEEWKEVFAEGWRVARDYFYDPNMHGVDWNAIRVKYEKQLPLVGTRTDLAKLMKDMVAELNVGHAYVIDPTPPPFPERFGYLGADFEPVPGHPAVKIAKIYRGKGFDIDTTSPLAMPGVAVNEGDYVLAINGEPLDEHQDFMACMIGMGGQMVALTVNSKPTMEGSHVITVKALGSESELRYNDWVLGRAQYVRDHGGPDFGYVHIPGMGGDGVADFTKGEWPNVLKPGMIYDIRYNGGGFTGMMILENLMHTPIDWWHVREGTAPWTRWQWANVGHKVALCNQDNFSDGEYFVEMWKRLKIGPLVGKRTGGGAIGSGNGYRLVDGSRIYVPNYGPFINGSWLWEGAGVTPDYDVDQDPASVMAGKDPQLDKAIELLKAELATAPVPKREVPPFPNKSESRSRKG